MVIVIVVSDDGVRFAATGVAVGKKAAAAADEDVGDGRLDDTRVCDGVVVFGDEDISE